MSYTRCERSLKLRAGRTWCADRARQDQEPMAKRGLSLRRAAAALRFHRTRILHCKRPTPELSIFEMSIFEMSVFEMRISELSVSEMG